MQRGNPDEVAASSDMQTKRRPSSTALSVSSVDSVADSTKSADPRVPFSRRDSNPNSVNFHHDEYTSPFQRVKTLSAQVNATKSIYRILKMKNSLILILGGRHS